MIPKHKLKALREAVKGSSGTIAERYEQRTGQSITIASVTRILAGDWMNKDLIESAIEVRDERQAEIDKLSSKI